MPKWTDASPHYFREEWCITFPLLDRECPGWYNLPFRISEDCRDCMVGPVRLSISSDEHPSRVKLANIRNEVAKREFV